MQFLQSAAANPDAGDVEGKKPPKRYEGTKRVKFFWFVLFDIRFVIWKWRQGLILFGFFHRAEFFFWKDLQQDKNDHQDAIEPKAQWIEEHRIAVFFDTDSLADNRKKSDFVYDPGADGSQTGYRCTGGVNDKSQLFSADAKPVRNRTHCRTDDHGIGIIVDETDNPHKRRRHLGGCFPFYPSQQPFYDSAKATGSYDELDHHKDGWNKRENLKVVDTRYCICEEGCGVVKAFKVARYVCRGVQKTGQKTAGNNCERKTDANLLGCESKQNRQKRRNDAVPWARIWIVFGKRCAESGGNGNNDKN